MFSTSVPRPKFLVNVPSAIEATVLELFQVLHKLDERLEKAVSVVQRQFNAAHPIDPFRGLHLSDEDISVLLDQEPGQPHFPLYSSTENEADTGACEYSRLAWLAKVYDLNPFETDVLLIALAPEIDLRYEKLYAYLQDDVSRRRPGVELILNILCATAQSKLEKRSIFSPAAHLVSNGLIHLVPDPYQTQLSPLLAHYVYVDEQIVDFLVGHEGLDRRLAPFCELCDPSISIDQVPVEPPLKCALMRLSEHMAASEQKPHLYFQGSSGSRKEQAAEALAGAASMRIIKADLARGQAASLPIDQAMQLLSRAAWMNNAVLYLDELDDLLAREDTKAVRVLQKALGESPACIILAGTQNWPPHPQQPSNILTLQFPVPGRDVRFFCWKNSLQNRGVPYPQDRLLEIASRFRLTPGQIDQAAAEIAAHRDFLGKADDSSEAELFEAARRQCGIELARLTQKVHPHATWDDIVLPSRTMEQLREICQRVKNHHLVWGEWGFDRKLSQGKGVTALFTGTSGTGKTMAAEVIAGDLGLDLYTIDLSGVVSKYIGETEKNLDRIFTAAETANAILFFDEADALFGKRSVVRDSHDRYANIEISYLLQKMEQYEGVAILATNLGQNLDEAFIRRLAFTVNFPFPDEESRRRIWQGIWPAEIKLSGDINLDFAAHHFKLSGGEIRNIAVAAAFLATGNGGVMKMEHFLRAVQREYQKMGKSLPDMRLLSSEG